MATKSNIPAIPADFKFTVLNDIEMNGITAKAAVMVHAMLIVKCEDREERLAQVQTALNEAFKGFVRKIELTIKESGDVRMRSVSMEGNASTSILQAGATLYMYIDNRTGRLIVAANLCQQWAVMKREFAYVGTPEYAFINPDFAMAYTEDEECEEKEDQEIVEKENVDMEGKDALIAALREKLEKLEMANSNLAHKVMDIESKNRELVNRVKATEKENNELAGRIEAAEKENMELRNGYMELTAMIEKIEGNANVEESKAEESVTAQEQDEVMESSTSNDPIVVMSKHADAIAADMVNISSRADGAKRSIESIAAKAATVRMETSQMMDKINAMQANKPDAVALKARLSAHLTAPLEVEETNSGDCP